MPQTLRRSHAQRHLFPHFTAGSVWRDDRLPILVRGKGTSLFDDAGTEYLDGLSGLFCVNIGHGREEMADVAASQMRRLAYWTNWGAAHPAAIDAAAKIASLAPGDLNTTFFVNSGSEAVESAVKLARQIHRSRGEAQRTKIIARDMAYHGTTLGALSVTGIPAFREPFGPLMPGVFHFPNTLGETVPAGGSAADLPSLQALTELLEREGGHTFAALFAEPVQNSRGSLVPPAGYWQELRKICDAHGILLVADEVITGFGRLGEWFGSGQQGVVPDLLTFAKGSTSGYAPLGGVLIREPLAQAIWDGQDGGTFLHGSTWGGHPVATAIASENLRILEAESVLENVRVLGPELRAGLEEIQTRHHTVSDVRGNGFFYTLEFQADRDAGRAMTAAESHDVLTRVMPEALHQARVITRSDNRGGTMLVLAPPLISDSAVLSRLLEGVEQVCSAVDNRLAPVPS